MMGEDEEEKQEWERFFATTGSLRSEGTVNSSANNEQTQLSGGNYNHRRDPRYLQV